MTITTATLVLPVRCCHLGTSGEIGSCELKDTMAGRSTYNLVKKPSKTLPNGILKIFVDDYFHPR
jgi:hypothetical protein